MTCKDKLKNFMNYSLPIIFIVFLVGTISDPYFDKRSLANKRRTYHDFKNATMSIITTTHIRAFKSNGGGWQPHPRPILHRMQRLYE